MKKISRICDTSMPPKCEYCGFARHERYYFQDCGRAWCCAEQRALKACKDSHIERPDWCPLVELPKEHGNLIDADVLIEESLKDGAYGYVDTEQICTAPVIIKGEYPNE